MSTISLGRSGIVGISYSETSLLKSNLMRANERRNSASNNINSAKVKLQVNGRLGRIRIESDNLQSYYSSLKSNNSKIEKIIRDIDYIVRRFKEVDSRCASRVRAISKGYKVQSCISKIGNSLISFGNKVFNGVSSFFKDGISIIKYISNSSNGLTNNFNSINNFKVSNPNFTFTKGILVNAFGIGVGEIVTSFNKDKILDDGKNIFNEIKSALSNVYTKYSKWSDERKLKIEEALIEKIDKNKIEWLDYENNEDICTWKEAKEYIEGGLFGLYSPDQIENIPKQIIYKKGIYIYVYELVKYTTSFNGIEIPTQEPITLKDGTIVDPNLYHYRIIDSDEPDIDIGVVSLPNNLKIPKVGNMSEFFKSEFGSSIQNGLTKTKSQFQGQSIYEVIKKIDNPYLKKGDKLYLDNLHKDHLEVFDKKGNIRAVLNLDGTLNEIKTKNAIGRKLK